ncbi:hypothetical protein CHRY9390_03224 [Chryseobacterium aquaeductus]|uniref:Lipoprotein n=1 Tax=Chryseobacterium aquaeductus TaxID=2675056 RepID=A0A9N8QRW2_9FLAO|nr:hypothetical protein [Chryseobacterium aquaeductus]CAA7332501.1 hypothetical protein CHRY9390_03224 [Chryseobacterium potabilaquae]CAD7816711.1 hypothetical protein CHRY9390_03224 [Chryseobacterium aquaeductus]
MKNIFILSILIILLGCNKGSEITEVINNQKIISEIDKFITDSNSKKKVKFIVISGIDDSNKNVTELLFANQKPTMIIENSKRINDEIKNEKYGYFKYKDYEFLVSERLDKTFKLKYENFDKMKDYFIIKDHYPEKAEIIKDKWRTMYLKYNKEKDSIEFSKISEISMSDYTH